MGSEEKSARVVGIRVPAIVLAIALCLAIPWALNDWLLTLPLLMICIGIYEVTISLSKRSYADRQEIKESNYTLAWGIFILIAGAMTVFSLLNIIWLFAILMAWLAGAIPLFSIRTKRLYEGAKESNLVLDTIRR